MKTRLFIWIPVVCVLLAALAIWIRTPEVPSVRLKDGSTLRLEFVGFQRKDSEGQKLRWLDPIRSWVAQKLGRPIFSRPGLQSDSLVYWISRREKDTGKYMGFDWLSHAVAVDAHGCEFDATPLMIVHSDNWAAGARPLPTPPAGAKYILVSGTLPVFPRREKTFKLRVYNRQLALVAEFEAPNPLYHRYPTWEPEDMPATHQAGDLTASLVSLSNRWTVDRHDGLELKRFSLAPEFQLATDWELSDLEVEDATGNRGTAEPFYPFRFHRQMHWVRDRELLSARFKLCTNETAWKLHATFFRTPEGRFSSNETWTIPDLKLPAPGSAKILQGSNTWQGVTVRLCFVAGPGSVTYSNGVPVSAALSSGGHSMSGGGRMSGGILIAEGSVDTDKPQVMIHLTGLNQESRFQGFARTGGSTYRCSDSQNNDYRLLQLPVPQGTDSVDLTFVIQRPRVIDFLVRPALPTD